MSDHLNTNNNNNNNKLMLSNCDRVSLMKRQTNLSKPRQCSSSQSNHQLPIISLSKLKNYMPQNQPIRFDTSCPNASNSSLDIAPSANSMQFPPVAYNENITNPSSYINNNNKLYEQFGTRVKALSLNSTLGSSKSEGKTPTYLESSGYHQELVNQVVARVTQQGLISNPKANPKTDSQNKDYINFKALEETKNSEPHQKLHFNKGDQIERKIDALDNLSQKERDYKSSYSGNNMTPSSLLLPQNQNYTEQQRDSICYSGDNQNSREQGNNSSIGQQRTATEDCSGVGTTATSAETSDDQRQTHCTNPDLSSSSSFMLPNVSHFKALDNVGNSIISSNSTPAPSANTVDTSDYLTNHNLNRIQSQQQEADTNSGTNSNNLHQNYQQGINCEFKSNSKDTQFNNYSAPARVSNNSYQTNFTSPASDQQSKLDSIVSERNIFENKYTFGSDPNNIQVGIPNVNSMIATRDLAQQQAMTSINQYYSHYNLMPTPSSKSSSPTSSNSTPSPKTSAMQPNASQHSNQLVSTSISNPASRIHLDHLNHHYMGGNVGASSINHPQHHINQHYSYGQQSTNTPNQAHLAMSGHEQSYGHQQQHHHHHHQPQHSHHQQQHQQQQQQQQQQLQQQQLHQQNVQNQQSIYHQLTNNTNNVGVNHVYSNTNAGNHYQTQNSTSGHQSNHLMSGSQSHLNTAAAACAAAAVVSQTLKTVANQHGQQHHYGGSMNGFSATTDGLMNMTAQNHQQFHPMSSLNNHHLNNQSSIAQQQQQQNLPVHHATTIVARKYQCKMCPQVFMSKAEMKYHNQNHMREAKPYKCLQCHKAFANSSYLSQHMRIHQGLKPYTCDICSRKFTQLSHLQQHKRTHTGDKPYKCTYMNCTKQFSQLSNLQSHSRCHQLDKPYKCNSCYKCFHDEQSLLEHIPRHLESKHLKKNLCIFCGSSYQQERGLVKHFQQYHTDKTPTLVAAAIAAGTTGNTSLIASLVSSTTSNSFAKPTNGGGSCSSSSSSSISSSGSLNVHNNINVVHSGSSGNFGTNQY